MSSLRASDLSNATIKSEMLSIKVFFFTTLIKRDVYEKGSFYSSFAFYLHVALASPEQFPFLASLSSFMLLY